MSNEEMLLAISEMMDKKIQPVNEGIKQINIRLENDVMPRLQNIEACYTSTYNRYAAGSGQIEAMAMDMELMKKVITEHSVTLQQMRG